MRYQGKVTDWNDERGFGFVTPNGGGPRVFIHIKSFSNRKRRPVGNELVTYELTSDTRGRPQGVNIAFVRNRSLPPPRTTAPGPGVMALSFAFVFLAFVTGAVAAGKLHFLVLVAYFTLSCVAYLAYAFDKAAALQKKWRTPENTLHLLSFLGGWPGAMLAQITLRHKTQKQSFQFEYWVTVVLNCAALGLLQSPTGMRILKSIVGAV